MKKVIFVIILFFIMGPLFPSQAIPSVSQKKTRHQPVSFSKKQKKLNFFQRIILKKIQRKIARQARKSNKQKKNQPNTNANKSFFFGLLSLLAVILGYLAFTSATSIGGALSNLFLFGLIAVILGVVAMINGFNHFEEKKIQGQKNGDDLKAGFGIVIGMILVGILIIGYTLS